MSDEWRTNLGIARSAIHKLLDDDLTPGEEQAVDRTLDLIEDKMDALDPDDDDS